MKTMLMTVACTAALIAGSAFAGDFKKINQACEEALALSAIPAELRERANVYVWQDGRFERTISSSGGIHCLVERNHPDAIIPQCVTAAGEDTVLPGLMFRTGKAAAGHTPDEVAAMLKAQFDAGTLSAPSKPGINYMLSAFNRIYVSQADRIVHVAPHTMTFAPGATDESIGGIPALAQSRPGYPMVLESGPHGYIVSFTRHTAEPDDVLAACKGQTDVTAWTASSG